MVQYRKKQIQYGDGVIYRMKNHGNTEFGCDSAGQTVILIPAYEPNEQLLKTVKGLLAAEIGPIVVVDDGSSRSCAAYFDVLEDLGVCVCRHSRNMGKGAAIKTGIRYILEHYRRCTGVVTADADGQHSPEDICRVAERTAQAGDALVLGVRDFDREGVPWNSLLGNRVTSLIFRMITHVRCPDTQTGLRGIPAGLFPLALAAEGNRYEYEMNFLLDVVQRKHELDMIQIQTLYMDGNSSSHFRLVRDSLLIYRRPLTFLFGALTSSLVDLAAFCVFLRFLFQNDRDWLFAASVLARLLSGCVNFALNKRLTFRSRGDTLREGGRYLCLFLAVMLVSSAGVTLLGRLPVPALPVKIAVDSLLFAVNYAVQSKWVFRREG